jgi:hypothetical protein
MSSAALSVRELTRRLIAHVAAQSDAPDSPALAAQAAWERAYRELARTLGPTGSHALVTRALAQAQTEHPLLQEIRIDRQATPAVDGVTAVAQAHGAPAVAAGLEALLESVLGLLGKLIGVDVVARLVDQSVRIETQHDEDVK